MNEIAVELEIEAEAELYKIVEYYKRFDQELPKDFIREFEDAVEKLMNFPNAGHPYLHQTKPCLPKSFSLCSCLQDLQREPGNSFCHYTHEPKTRLLERST